jgi:hypothetical protein
MVDEVVSMNKKVHKFKGKMQLTYEEYFHRRFDRQVQLIKEFERVFGLKKTFEIVGKANEKFAVESTEKQIAERQLIRNFEEFKTYVKKENSSPFWSHVLTITYPQETSNKIVFNVTECLWAKTFKELNAADIGYILCCRPDFAIARAYHPNIRLKRTKTLMQGDRYCNHTYYWKELKVNKKPSPNQKR